MNISFLYCYFAYHLLRPSVLSGPYIPAQQLSLLLSIPLGLLPSFSSPLFSPLLRSFFPFSLPSFPDPSSRFPSFFRSFVLEAFATAFFFLPSFLPSFGRSFPSLLQRRPSFPLRRDGWCHTHGETGGGIEGTCSTLIVRLSDYDLV